MIYNLTPEQQRWQQDFRLMNSLEQIDKGLMYRIIYVGKGAGKGYDTLAECVEEADKYGEVEFSHLYTNQQGDVANEHILTNWYIDDLEYIHIFEIGLKEEFPEYLL